MTRTLRLSYRIFWKCISAEELSASLPALVVTIAIVALPLLCVLHCQNPPDPAQGAPRSVLFLCHLVPGFASISSPYAIDSAGSHLLTLRAVYDGVVTPVPAVVCLLLALARYCDGAVHYRSFAFPPPFPPPRN